MIPKYIKKPKSRESKPIPKDTGAEKPSVFPFVPIDTRQGVALEGNPVLISGYPAGFLGGATLRKDLWPVSTIVNIQKLYTFVSSTIDILSLGGNIAAQGGSSGGAVINQWGKLVGIVVTSSVADNTEDRDLRAITLFHINNSVKEHLGVSLIDFLQQGDFDNKMKIFQENSVPHLLENYNI